MAVNNKRKLINQVRNGKVRVPKKHGKTSKVYAVDLHLDGVDDSDMKQKKRLGCSVCDAAFRQRRGVTIANLSTDRFSEASLHTREGVHGEPHFQSHLENIVDCQIEAQTSESYLRGALWLGRNILMVIQDLSVDLDIYRSEVSVLTPHFLISKGRY